LFQIFILHLDSHNFPPAGLVNRKQTAKVAFPSDPQRETTPKEAYDTQKCDVKIQSNHQNTKNTDKKYINPPYCPTDPPLLTRQAPPRPTKSLMTLHREKMMEFKGKGPEKVTSRHDPQGILKRHPLDSIVDREQAFTTKGRMSREDVSRLAESAPRFLSSRFGAPNASR
jgi:hypothetical protein